MNKKQQWTKTKSLIDSSIESYENDIKYIKKVINSCITLEQVELLRDWVGVAEKTALKKVCILSNGDRGVITAILMTSHGYKTLLPRLLNMKEYEVQTGLSAPWLPM